MNNTGAISRAEYFSWRILLIFIFLRPFLSEHAFLTVGSWYIFLLILFSAIFLAFSAKQVLYPLYLNLWPSLFLIIILFSMLIAGYAAQSLLELYFFIPNILIFYIASKIKPLRQRQLLLGVFLAASIICIYAIYQYFIGLRHTLKYLNPAQQSGPIGKFLNSKRVFATFISPNIFSSYIVMMLFVSIGLLRSSKGTEKLIYCMGIAVMALSLLYTKSFGGLLAFAIAFLLFMPHLFPSFALTRAKITWFSFIVIFVTCFFILICKFFFWDRLSQLLDLHNPNNSIVQRLYYWKASIDMIKDAPFTGIGWRRFGALYGFYKPFLANISHYSHNVFLQILVETGPLGLAVFLSIVITFLINGLIVMKKNTERRFLKIGLFYAGCAFLIQNFIDLSFYFGQAAFFWWMIAGLFSNFRLENASMQEHDKKLPKTNEV